MTRRSLLQLFFVLTAAPFVYKSALKHGQFEPLPTFTLNFVKWGQEEGVK